MYLNKLFTLLKEEPVLITRLIKSIITVLIVVFGLNLGTVAIVAIITLIENMSDIIFLRSKVTPNGSVVVHSDDEEYQSLNEFDVEMMNNIISDDV